MYFLTVKNNVITGKHAGDLEKYPFAPDSEFASHDVVSLEKTAWENVRTGDTVDMYTGDWQKKTFPQLVQEGLAVLKKGWKIVDDKPVEMSDEEKIIAGLKEPLAGTKVANNQIVQMTQEELYETGQISKQDFEAYKSRQNERELSNRLAVLNTPENQAQAIVDEEFSTFWKAQIAALLAVKEQSGWPVTVRWPE